jgi:hypothetical protein
MDRGGVANRAGRELVVKGTTRDRTLSFRPESTCPSRENVTGIRVVTFYHRVGLSKHVMSPSHPL